MPSDKNFLYHLIISQLYYDGYGPYASLLEQAALNTNRAIGPSDRLKQMLSMCAHTVRDVDNYFDSPVQNQQFEEDSMKEPDYIPAERLVRSTTPSHYHTLARRRLSAAKRHSFMSMNRSKQNRAAHKTIFSSTVPKTSHIPIIYSSTSTMPEIPITSGHVQDLLNNPNEQNSGGLFSSDKEKSQSAEAVRVLQNIFQQKQDIMPTITSIASLTTSEMSQDLNSIIYASSNTRNPTSPTTSNHSLTPTDELPGLTSPDSPEKMDLTPSPISGSSRSAFSPPNKSSAVASSALENMAVVEPIYVNTNSKGSGVSDVEKNMSPVLPPTQLNKDVFEKSDCQPIAAEDVIRIKEEKDDVHESNCIDSIETPKIYPPASQDIIDQLNSLTASGIGNIQNLANSISNSFSESNLTEGNLANLSSLSMESLASSLNLSMANVTGLEEQSNPSSRVGIGSGAYSGAGKLDFLSRLEGDSPSMLSMMTNQSSRPSPLSTTPPNPGCSGLGSGGRTTSSSIKAFQCQECPRSYSSKYALVRHARQHTNSHLRACPFCGRTSTRADIIRVHMTNCVKKYIRTIEETALQLQGGDTMTGQDPDSYLLAITRLAAEQEAIKEEAPAQATTSNKL